MWIPRRWRNVWGFSGPILPGAGKPTVLYGMLYECRVVQVWWEPALKNNDTYQKCEEKNCEPCQVVKQNFLMNHCKLSNKDLPLESVMSSMYSFSDESSTYYIQWRHLQVGYPDEPWYHQKFCSVQKSLWLGSVPVSTLWHSPWGKMPWLFVFIATQKSMWSNLIGHVT